MSLISGQLESGHNLLAQVLKNFPAQPYADFENLTEFSLARPLLFIDFLQTLRKTQTVFHAL